MRERRLLETELTLDAALVIARRVEQALRESKLLTQDSNVPSTSQVAALTRSTAKSSKPGQKCYRCGSSAHLADATSCPARAETCKKCGTRGHFAAVCRKSAAVKTTASINAKALMNIQGLPDILYCEMIIAGVALKLQVDTGSPVSIISSALYDAHFRHIKLEHSNLELRNYSNRLIEVYGMPRLKLHGGKR